MKRRSVEDKMGLRKRDYHAASAWTDDIARRSERVGEPFEYLQAANGVGDLL